MRMCEAKTVSNSILSFFIYPMKDVILEYWITSSFHHLHVTWTRISLYFKCNIYYMSINLGHIFSRIKYRDISWSQYIRDGKGWWLLTSLMARRVWRYQRGNHNPYIEKEQTTQWSKEKVRKDKQRSTKHTYKTKDRVTWTPPKTGGELRCFHH